MARKFQTLTSWIEQAINDQDKAPKKLSRLACMYVKPSGAEQQIHSTAVTPSRTANELGTLFQRIAEGHAQELPGVQSFRLVAFYESDEPESFHPFQVLNGELRNGSTSAPAETADMQGLLQQFMRHLEKKDSLVIELCGKVIERDDKLQTEITACYDVIRKDMIERVNLEFNRQKELAEFQRATEERKAIMALLPVLLNTLSGAEVIPNTTADTALIEGLARAVPLESVQMMVQSGMIPAKLVAPLMTRMKQVLDQDNKTSEALAKVPPANTNPLQDVQGN